MKLKVETDRDAGFCGGVIRAIGTAEQFLSGEGNRRLFSLGSIVHNEEELTRLEAKGLVTVSLDELRPGDDTLLIRAHGEPPSTYSRASSLGYRVIDCTCPVVLQLQRRIREAYSRLGGEGQLLIFGKIGHAEVLGLLGQVNGDAVVFESLGMLEDFISRGVVDPGRPLEIFSQTTKSPDEYREICDFLKARAADLRIHDTICAQVSSRHSHLEDFARSHDVVIFVSGRDSSNGRVLFNLCKGVNDRVYRVSSPLEVDQGWFRDGDSVGVSGATSTPKWLLEEVAKKILQV